MRGVRWGLSREHPFSPGEGLNRGILISTEDKKSALGYKEGLRRGPPSTLQYPPNPQDPSSAPNTFPDPHYLQKSLQYPPRAPRISQSHPGPFNLLQYPRQSPPRTLPEPLSILQDPPRASQYPPEPPRPSRYPQYTPSPYPALTSKAPKDPPSAPGVPSEHPQALKTPQNLPVTLLSIQVHPKALQNPQEPLKTLPVPPIPTQYLREPSPHPQYPRRAPQFVCLR